ncbi:MAG: hypothetical protein JNG88_08835 [Phycisphaerales bacterium]|nr:hypothetical protein [Phycisphaerales bacterium]
MAETAATPLFDPRPFLRHNDVLQIRPAGPPLVTLYEELSADSGRGTEWTPGYWQSRSCIEALLIDEADFEKCKQAPIENFDHVTDAFKVDSYDGPPKYVPGEQAELYCEDAGIVAVEPVYFDQLWDGHGGKCLIEPSQRLTLYLGLEQRPSRDATTEWIDPYNNQVVMKRRDAGTRREERQLTIRLDRLRDYLAARGKCLYVRRWCERFFTLTDDQLEEFGDDVVETVEAGQIRYKRREILGAKCIEANLSQHFLIRPVGRPAHYLLQDHSAGTPPAEFLNERGDPITPESPAPLMSVISFRRQVLDQFRTRVDGGWALQSIAPGTMWLIFPRGQSLHVSDSPHGQVQCFLKDLYELDREYQDYMRGFCEMSEGKPHPNWWRPSMGHGPPEEAPFEGRLNSAKERLCKAISRVAKDSPFACTAEPVRSADVVRPHPNDGIDFARVCKEVYRKLLTEGRPDDFVRAFGLPALQNEERSLAAINKFLEKHAPEKAAQLIHPFRALNGFRQVDAHPKPMDDALGASGYVAQADFGARFDRLFDELSAAMELMAVLVEREVPSVESAAAPPPPARPAAVPPTAER